MAQVITKPELGFVEAVKLVFANCLKFTGRSRRSEYWWWILFNLIVNLALGWIPIIGAIISLVMIFMGIAVTFRRLHDTGHSGWWWGAQYILFFVAVIAALLSGLTAAKSGDPFTMIMAIFANPVTIVIGLIMFIMSICVFIFTLLDSKPAPNKYGESPKYQIVPEGTPNATAAPEKSDFDKALEAVADKIDETTDKATEAVGDAAADLKEKADDIIDDVKEKADDVISDVKDKIDDVKDGLKD